MVNKSLVPGLKKLYNNNSLLFNILIGVLVGTVAGGLLRHLNLDSDVAALIGYPGEIFLRALKLIVLPFIVCCVIIGTAALNISHNKAIAGRVIAYFFSTSFLNVVLGITLATLLTPGQVSLDKPAESLKTEKISLLEALLDVGRNLIADNLFETTFQQTYTVYSEKNLTRDGGGIESIRMKSTNLRHGTNTLGLTFFCVVFGCILGTLQAQKHTLLKFFSSVYDVLQRMLLLVIWFTPFCVASIICNKIITVPDIWKTLQQLGYFGILSVSGILFYQLVIAQLIYFVVVRKNPFKYYFRIMPAILTGFATASKAASLPVMFQVMETLKMNPKISQFVLPIGTINLNGSAQFMGFAVVFLSQLEGMTLSAGDLITLAFACTFGSMSSAAVPSAAIVMIVTICSVVSIPTGNVGLLLSIDWLIDRFRTATNILGDCYTVAVVQQWSGSELEGKSQKQDEEIGKPADVNADENTV